MPDPLTDLRGAAARSDGPAVVALLADLGGRPVRGLQLAGDGLIVALAASVDGAALLANRCVEALRERDRDGDAELAAALAARPGTAPVPLLRPMPVDLGELAGILEGDPVHGGGRIDLRTGEVWTQVALDYLDEVGEQVDDEADDERWLWVDLEGARGRARAWLADHGYTPTPPRPRT